MKLVSLMLVSLLVCEGAGFAGQAPPTTETSQVQTQETPQAAKVKDKVQKRGTGEKSRVNVKLVSGLEVKGYISKIEETSFTVTGKKTGQTTTVPYGDVQKIRGPGLSKNDKILIGVGVGVAVVVVVSVILVSSINKY